MVKEISPPSARFTAPMPSAVATSSRIPIPSSSKRPSSSTKSSTRTPRLASAPASASTRKRAILGERDDGNSVSSGAGSTQKSVKSKPRASPKRPIALITRITPTTASTPRPRIQSAPRSSIPVRGTPHPRHSISMPVGSTAGDETQLLDVAPDFLSGLSSPGASETSDADQTWRHATPKKRAAAPVSHMLTPENSQETMTRMPSSPPVPAIRRFAALPTPPASQSNENHHVAESISTVRADRIRPRPAPTPPRRLSKEPLRSPAEDPSPNPRRKKSPRVADAAPSPVRSRFAVSDAALSHLSRFAGVASQPTMPHTPTAKQTSTGTSRIVPATAPPARGPRKSVTATAKKTATSTAAKSKKRQSLPAASTRRKKPIRKTLTPEEILKLTGTPLGVLEKEIVVEPGEDPLLLKAEEDDEAWLRKRRMSRSFSASTSRSSTRRERSESATAHAQSLLAGPSRLREVVSLDDSPIRSPEPREGCRPREASHELEHSANMSGVEPEADSGFYDLEYDTAPGWASDDGTEIADDNVGDQTVEAADEGDANDTFAHIVLRKPGPLVDGSSTSNHMEAAPEPSLATFDKDDLEVDSGFSQTVMPELKATDEAQPSQVQGLDPISDEECVDTLHSPAHIARLASPTEHDECEEDSTAPLPLDVSAPSPARSSSASSPIEEDNGDTTQEALSGEWDMSVDHAAPVFEDQHETPTSDAPDMIASPVEHVDFHRDDTFSPEQPLAPLPAADVVAPTDIVEDEENEETSLDDLVDDESVGHEADLDVDQDSCRTGPATALLADSPSAEWDTAVPAAQISEEDHQEDEREISPEPSQLERTLSTEDADFDLHCDAHLSTENHGDGSTRSRGGSPAPNDEASLPTEHAVDVSPARDELANGNAADEDMPEEMLDETLSQVSHSTDLDAENEAGDTTAEADSGAWDVSDVVDAAETADRARQEDTRSFHESTSPIVVSVPIANERAQTDEPTAGFDTSELELDGSNVEQDQASQPEAITVQVSPNEGDRESSVRSPSACTPRRLQEEVDSETEADCSLTDLVSDMIEEALDDAATRTADHLAEQHRLSTSALSPSTRHGAELPCTPNISSSAQPDEQIAETEDDATLDAEASAWDLSGVDDSAVQAETDALSSTPFKVNLAETAKASPSPLQPPASEEEASREEHDRSDIVEAAEVPHVLGNDISDSAVVDAARLEEAAVEGHHDEDRDATPEPQATNDTGDERTSHDEADDAALEARAGECDDRPDETVHRQSSRIVVRMIERGVVKVEQPSDSFELAVLVEPTSQRIADSSSAPEDNLPAPSTDIHADLPPTLSSATDDSQGLATAAVTATEPLLAPGIPVLADRAHVDAPEPAPVDSIPVRRQSASSSTSSRPSRGSTFAFASTEVNEQRPIAPSGRLAERSPLDQQSQLAGDASFESVGNDSFRSVVEVSSLDPRAAARAAAILKLNHAYIEHGVLPSSTPTPSSSTIPLPTPSTPGSSRLMPRTPRSEARRRKQWESKHFATADSARKLNRDELLYEAELEIVAARRSRSRSRAKSQGPQSENGWESDETEMAVPGGWRATPGKRKRSHSTGPRSRSSTSTRQDEAPAGDDKGKQKDHDKVDGRPWGVPEWKRLEKIYRAEKEAWVKEREVKPLPGLLGWAKKALAGTTEVQEWDNERVVERFVAEENAKGLSGEWAEKMIRLRVKALEKRVNATKTTSERSSNGQERREQKKPRMDLGSTSIAPMTPRRDHGDEGNSTVVSIVPPSTIRRMLGFVWRPSGDTSVISEAEEPSIVDQPLEDTSFAVDKVQGKKVENKLLTRLKEVRDRSSPLSSPSSLSSIAESATTGEAATPMKQIAIPTMSTPTRIAHPSSPIWTPPIPGAFRSSFNLPPRPSTPLAPSSCGSLSTGSYTTPKLYPTLNPPYAQRSSALKALFDTPSGVSNKTGFSLGQAGNKGSPRVLDMVKNFEKDGTFAKALGMSKAKRQE